MFDAIACARQEDSILSSVCYSIVWRESAFVGWSRAEEWCKLDLKNQGHIIETNDLSSSI